MLEYLKRVKIGHEVLVLEDWSKAVLREYIKAGDMPRAYYETCNVIKQIEGYLKTQRPMPAFLREIEGIIDFNNATKPTE